MDWPERWKGKALTHRLVVWLVAHWNARVASNNPPSGILAIGRRRRAVIKGKDEINPDAKHFNCKFVLFKVICSAPDVVKLEQPGLCRGVALECIQA